MVSVRGHLSGLHALVFARGDNIYIYIYLEFFLAVGKVCWTDPASIIQF